jgi:predicted acyltransferase
MSDSTAPSPTPPLTNSTQTTGASTSAVPPRLASLDAYRGFVMFLMAAEVLHLSRVSRALPESGFWKFLAWHQTHVEWVGCTLHDLIQPSFTFMVGVALPFSIASRLSKGQTYGKMLGHAIWRSLILIFLGIFLRSIGRPQLNFTFEDTLTQIGLGYTFAFLLAFASQRALWIALGTILAGYWALFALYPAPGPDFNWAAVGVPADWPYHLSGFAQHWDKNSNFAAAFDTWFMNLFPREKPFLYNGGGYLTLSFIPTLGTMLFGLVCGRWLKQEGSQREKIIILLKAGAICMVLAVIIHVSGICPIVKRIWTPSWTLYSAGWAFFILTAFYFLIDVKGWRRWAFPLVVIGMNSIAMYVMAHLIDGFILKGFQTIFGQNIYKTFGEAYASLFSGAVVLGTLWLILFWMYRRRLFLKI